MNLSEKAFLVKISVGEFSTARNDEELGGVALRSISASSRAGLFLKHRFDPSSPEYRDCLSAHRAVRQISERLTSPWADGGYRVITSDLFPRWKSETDKGLEAANKALDALILALPRIKSETSSFLSAGYRESEFPSESEVRSKFWVSRTFQPLPNTTDWRLSVGEDEAKWIRQEAQETYQLQFEQAQQAAVLRLKEAVGHMAKKLGEYTVDPATGKTKGVFRDSMVENIRELVQTLPYLNLTEDREFDRAISACREYLCAHDPDVLRQSPAIRANVQEQANEILAGLSGLIG
jgi:hypothetical protein